MNVGGVICGRSPFSVPSEMPMLCQDNNFIIESSQVLPKWPKEIQVRVGVDQRLAFLLLTGLCEKEIWTNNENFAQL
jgi:hypothetical protein